MTIDVSLNRLFRVHRPRPLLQQVLMYWAVITLGPVLIGGSLSMTSFAVGASFGWLQLSRVADFILGVLPFVFTCVALTLLYALVPNRHVELRHAADRRRRRRHRLRVRQARLRALSRALSDLYADLRRVRHDPDLPRLAVSLMGGGARRRDADRDAARLPLRARAGRSPGRDFVERSRCSSVLARAQDEGGAVRLRQISNQVRLMPHRCEAVLERAARARLDRAHREGQLGAGARRRPAQA